jgi:pterin-4a-carbinolamine dehydratase
MPLYTVLLEVRGYDDIGTFSDKISHKVTANDRDEAIDKATRLASKAGLETHHATVTLELK